MVHPFIVGELALGHLKDRAAGIEALHALPAAPRPRHAEVLLMVENAPLFGRGIGLIDAYLLASAKLHENARLWTRDRKLNGIAASMSLAFQE